MDFKNWLHQREQATALGPPVDGIPPDAEDPLRSGTGGFWSYSDDDKPPTPRSEAERRKRVMMKKKMSRK